MNLAAVVLHAVSDEPLSQRQFRNTAVRLADLTVNTDRITGYTFDNCQIIGPAIVLAVGGP